MDKKTVFQLYEFLIRSQPSLALMPVKWSWSSELETPCTLKLASVYPREIYDPYGFSTYP